uniref:Candidate secreted effector n=1 Tax=Meloidogyne incognita TaxID=6306 RepID=A0A914LRA5_MELIC
MMVQRQILIIINFKRDSRISMQSFRFQYLININIFIDVDIVCIFTNNKIIWFQ